MTEQTAKDHNAPKNPSRRDALRAIAGGAVVAATAPDVGAWSLFGNDKPTSQVKGASLDTKKYDLLMNFIKDQKFTLSDNPNPKSSEAYDAIQKAIKDIERKEGKKPYILLTFGYSTCTSSDKNVPPVCHTTYMNTAKIIRKLADNKIPVLHIAINALATDTVGLTALLSAQSMGEKPDFIAQHNIVISPKFNANEHAVALAQKLGLSVGTDIDAHSQQILAFTPDGRDLGKQTALTDNQTITKLAERIKNDVQKQPAKGK